VVEVVVVALHCPLRHMLPAAVLQTNILESLPQPPQLLLST
jgi:hypothetical protein